MRTIAYYRNIAYRDFPEDDWSYACEVENAEDIFKFMRECYLRDAMNRNDYPIVSFYLGEVEFYINKNPFSNPTYDFSEEGMEEIADPDYYLEGKQRFIAWRDRLQRTLPHLRKVAELRKEEEKERKLYERLKEKYADKQKEELISFVNILLDDIHDFNPEQSQKRQNEFAINYLNK